MIQFNKFTLSNGLRVLVHEDCSTPFVVVNLTYDVGARDEHESRTGFAHLFEHLMFGGSDHAPIFDRPLELAGATNNAFTNSDFTNYYEVIPRENIETALFLESDRMRYLTINEHTLEIQRKVVVEEFKERYLNQPYGETWHYLRQLAYQSHPYRWPTIGLTTEHIEQATLQDVQAFYDKHYQPSQAVLTLAGNITLVDAEQLVNKYFGELQNESKVYQRDLPKEKKQTEPRRLEIELDVPLDSLHIAFHMPAYGEGDYYVCDLISDVLGNGESARLHQELVKKQQLFTSLNAYILGSSDEGLFVIDGKLNPNMNREQAEQAVWAEIKRLTERPLEESELQKVKNKVEAAHVVQQIDNMNKAIHLSLAELRGDANTVNQELSRYQEITPVKFQQVAEQLFQTQQANTLWQIAKK